MQADRRGGTIVGRVARRVVALLAIVLLAAACSLPAPSSTGAGPDDLVWASGGSAAAPGATNSKVAKLYTKQDSSRPTVKVVQLPDAADLQREQMAYELQAGSGSFDILALDVIWTGEFAVNGWIEKLEDRRGDLEGVVLDSALQSALHEDEVWAAPFNTNAGFLYYRTDLVDKPRKTWDELAKVAKEVSEKEGIGGYVGQGFQYEGMVVNFLEYYWGGGGEVFNEDATEVLWDDEIALQAVEFMLESTESEFFASGFNTFLEEESRNEFQSGKAVFMRNWPYVYALANDKKESEIAGKFDIAPLPTFTGEGTISALGGFNNAVSAFSDNPEAAKEFVVWASTNEEVQTLLGKSSLPPTMASVYENLQDDPVMALLSEVLPDAKPRPPAPTWNDISVTIQQEIFPAYNGEKDPQEAVEAVGAFLEESIQ